MILRDSGKYTVFKQHMTRGPIWNKNNRIFYELKKILKKNTYSGNGFEAVESPMKQV